MTCHRNLHYLLGYLRQLKRYYIARPANKLANLLFLKKSWILLQLIRTSCYFNIMISQTKRAQNTKQIIMKMNTRINVTMFILIWISSSIRVVFLFFFFFFGSKALYGIEYDIHSLCVRDSFPMWLYQRDWGWGTFVCTVHDVY